MTFQNIRKRQPEVSFAYKKGRAKKILRFAKMLEAKAMGNTKDGDAACIMFYLKTQAGWRQKRSVETKDITPSKSLPQINIQISDNPAQRFNN